MFEFYEISGVFLWNIIEELALANLANGTYDAGDMFSIYIDSEKIYFYKNGEYLYSQSISSGSTWRYYAYISSFGTNNTYSFENVRMYPTGKIGPTGHTGPQVTNITTQNATGATLTSTSVPVLTTATSGTYYNITNSSFNTLILPTSVVGFTAGSFWVLRNNTSTYLSITVSNQQSSTPPNPLVIPPSNSVTIVWNGTTYVLF
jgi:hypothetical protein